LHRSCHEAPVALYASTMELFRRFAHGTAIVVGSAYTFVAAVVLVVGWLLTGPLFRFSDSWQLIINTSTTIITFLMVFVIQNAQNRDARSLHLKLDELLYATKGAKNSMIDLTRMTDRQLEALEHHYQRLCDMEEHELKAELAEIAEQKAAAAADQAGGDGRAKTTT
jgi:low affinity Fe/Cu permease